MSLIGKLLYNLYYEPKARKAMIRKFGGKQSYREMLAAEQEMRNYALNQLVIESAFNPKGKFRLNFLTGDRFIHQTLFCTYSFFKYLTPEECLDFSVNYYSDGTLTDNILKVLKTNFPRINIISFDESMNAVKSELPVRSFPSLVKKIDTHPLYKKMIFPHLSAKGLSIFFDSDMLFLRKPLAFLDWLYQYDENKNSTFCIRDVQRSYGYTNEQINQVWPAGVKTDVNSGMYAMRSEQMDMLFIEKMVRDFESNFGSEYYSEQLITGILLEKPGNLYVASPEDYIVYPSASQIMGQQGVLHHYVNESKALYFKESWRKQVSS